MGPVEAEVMEKEDSNRADDSATETSSLQVRRLVDKH